MDAHARASLPQAHDFVARTPCPICDTTEALLVPSNGQNVVQCARCGRKLYNAPKTETGERRRTVSTIRRSIKPSQQARILDRDDRTCVLCGRGDVPLAIGHLLSVNDGFALGATESELYDDANLAAMCEACNAGLGGHSVSPRTYAVIMFQLVRAEQGRTARPQRQRDVATPQADSVGGIAATTSGDSASRSPSCARARQAGRSLRPTTASSSRAPMWAGGSAPQRRQPTCPSDLAREDEHGQGQAEPHRNLGDAHDPHEAAAPASLPPNRARASRAQTLRDQAPRYDV